MTHERLHIGQVVQNRYRIEAELGIGGMGAVFRASDLILDASVAIKENLVLRTAKSHPTETINRDEVQRAQIQFELEAKILAQLRHPNLPRVTDYFLSPDGRQQYLVMDYVPGWSLKERVVRGGRLDPDEAVRIALVICDVLAYLHDQDPPVIHRDIKPPNIRLTETGCPFLVDFGIAKRGSGETTTCAQAVSECYSPVEQYGSGSEHTDARSDIHALGATLFYILTGTPPPPIARRIGDTRPVGLGDHDLPDRLRRAVAKAMALRAEDRFSSAMEFRAELQAIRMEIPSAETQRNAELSWTSQTQTRSMRLPSERTLTQRFTDATRILRPRPSGLWMALCATLIGTNPTGTEHVTPDPGPSPDPQRPAIDDAIVHDPWNAMQATDTEPSFGIVIPELPEPPDVSDASEPPSSGSSTQGKAFNEFGSSTNQDESTGPDDSTRPDDAKDETSFGTNSGGHSPPFEETRRRSLTVAGSEGDFADLAVAINQVNTNPQFSEVHTITLRSERYWVSGNSGLWIGKPIIIEGSGSTELQLDATQGLILQCPQVTIRGVVIRSSRSTAIEVPAGKLILEDCILESSSTAAVLVHGSGHAVLRRTRIQNSSGKGVMVIGGARAELISCTIQGAESGVEVARSGAFAELRNTEVIGSRQSGLHIHDSGRVRIVGSRLLRNGYSGINVDRGGAVEVRQCRIAENAQFGVNAGSTASVVFDDSDLGGNSWGAVNAAPGARIEENGTNPGL